MLKHILLLCLINIFAITLGQRSNGCSLSCPRVKDDKNQPIILSEEMSNFELLLPKRTGRLGKIDLQSQESIYLLCSPSDNKLIQSGQSLTHVPCVSGTTFNINGREYDFKDLECKNTVRAENLPTDNRCGNNRGKIMHIGFKPANNDWLSTIQICYDDNSGASLYAEHIIHGEVIAFKSSQTYRPSFSQIGLPSSISFSDDPYTQANQKRVFTELLGSEEMANNYLNYGSYLARGHLAPHADFLFPGLQYSTYFYINTCPQWSTINGGNWVRIENMVRRTADAYQKSLKIITGTHGVLSLRDNNANLQEVYLLKNRKLPVPKFVWKIVYDAERSQGIAFVMSNDPFPRINDSTDYLCPTNVCRQYGWHDDDWTNIKKGFVHCCDVNVLKNVIPTIPDLTITRILQNPH